MSHAETPEKLMHFFQLIFTVNIIEQSNITCYTVSPEITGVIFYNIWVYCTAQRSAVSLKKLLKTISKE